MTKNESPTMISDVSEPQEPSADEAGLSSRMPVLLEALQDVFSDAYSSAQAKAILAVCETLAGNESLSDDERADLAEAVFALVSGDEGGARPQSVQAIVEAASGLPDPHPWEDFALVDGSESPHLYAPELMSGSFAHLLLLKKIDDDELTFVDRVRGESKLYPRPIKATSLSAPPLRIAPERVEAIFESLQASGAYPDLHRICASNGDVYYYSSDYLSEVLALRSAERRSVERLDRL